MTASIKANVDGSAAIQVGGSDAINISSGLSVGIGTSSPATILNAYDATQAIISVDGDSTTNFRASRYSTDPSGPALTFRKTRGTLASPTAVNSADAVGQINFQAYGGSNFRAIAQIFGFCETYTADDNISGALVFNTRPAGAGATSTERARIPAAGGFLVTSDGGGLGYGTGSGGTVTQGAGSGKATGVTLNKPTGQITMNNAALASNTTVSFNLTNSLIAQTDNIIVTLSGGVSSQNNYNIWAYPQAGFTAIQVRNISGGSLSEAIVINFAIIKGATS